MAYIDGYVVAVPAANKDRYIEEACKAWPSFRDKGAVEMFECWGDDVPDGEVTSFPMAVKAMEDEVVLFSWVVWPDKETRDKGNAAMHEEYEAGGMDMSMMPFDAKRMIWGGFAPIVHEKAE